MIGKTGVRLPRDYGCAHWEASAHALYRERSSCGSPFSRVGQGDFYPVKSLGLSDASIINLYVHVRSAHTMHVETEPNSTNRSVSAGVYDEALFNATTYIRTPHVAYGGLWHNHWTVQKIIDIILAHIFSLGALAASTCMKGAGGHQQHFETMSSLSQTMLCTQAYTLS